MAKEKTGPPPGIGLNSLRDVPVNGGGGRSAECVRNMDILKMGGGPHTRGPALKAMTPPRNEILAAPLGLSVEKYIS